MSTTESTTESPAAEPAQSMLSQRVGSFLAFAPLAVWTTWHLYSNLAAFQGPEQWEHAVSSPRAPLVELLTSTIVLLPLVIHTVWGIRRLRIAKYNNGSYSTFDNLKFLLQRLSAVGLVLFLGAHLTLARFKPLLTTGRHESFADISYEMHHNPPTFIVYILGVLAVSYHLANGLATGGLTWGFAATETARKRLQNISYLFFVLLIGMGWGTIFALWNAGEHQRRMEPRADSPAIPAQQSH